MAANSQHTVEGSNPMTVTTFLHLFANLGSLGIMRCLKQDGLILVSNGMESIGGLLSIHARRKNGEGAVENSRQKYLGPKPWWMEDPKPRKIGSLEKVKQP